MTCIWDEVKPNICRHLSGRNWELVEAGDDEDGVYINEATGQPIGRRPHPQ